LYKHFHLFLEIWGKKSRFAGHIGRKALFLQQKMENGEWPCGGQDSPAASLDGTQTLLIGTDFL